MLSSRNIRRRQMACRWPCPRRTWSSKYLYLTKGRPGAKGEGRAFGSVEEVILALEAGEVELLTPIRLRYTGELIDLTSAYDDQDVPHTASVTLEEIMFISTTVNYVILNDHLPQGRCPSSTA